MTFAEVGNIVYEAAVHIETTGDVDFLDTLIPDYFENSKQLLNRKNKLESLILDIIEEDAVCEDFNEDIIRKAVSYGYYPMSMEKRVLNASELDKYFEQLECKFKYAVSRHFLTVKHHKEKMIIDFNDFKYPHKTHKWARQTFGDYTLTFNKNFTLCAEAIVNTYTEGTWLTKPLIEAFKNINENPDDEVSIDSVELWNGDELVAGELGFITHNAYASLCGFHTENNSGTIQMAALGEYLKANNFAYWDLGMELPYKHKYGAKLCNRDKQAEYLKGLSEEKLSFTTKEIKIKELL